MVKKYVVSLSAEEKALLESLVKSGTERVRKINHARILLRANDGWADQAIREALDVSIPTIQRVRYRFVEQSFEEALCPRPTRRKYERLLDGVQEAYLVALACGTPPAGHRRWSLRLLAQEMVRLKEFNDRCEDVANKGLRSGKQKFTESMKTLSEEVGGAFDENGKPSTAMLAILDADEPHKVILYLGDKPELAAELAALSPQKQIRRIAMIEREMAESATPKPSNVPKPAQPVKAAGDSGEPDPKDTARWIAWENEKLRARRSRT